MKKLFGRDKTKVPKVASVSRDLVVGLGPNTIVGVCLFFLFVSEVERKLRTN